MNTQYPPLPHLKPLGLDDALAQLGDMIDRASTACDARFNRDTAIIAKLTQANADLQAQLDEALKQWAQCREDNKRLREALQGLFDMVEAGTLVRDISRDGDTASFMHQACHLVRVLSAVQSALGQKAGQS